MKKLFTLGDLYISDFVKDGENPRGGKHDLQLILEEDTGAVRLEHPAPLCQMFGKYFYRSGINDTMKSELKGIVDSILKLYPLKHGDTWLDIACNDGTLLGYVPDKFIRIGIDPADETYYEESKKHADLVIQDYFSKEAYTRSRLGGVKPKVITAIAMFYDISSPDKFLQEVYEVLDDDGLLVMQLSHSGLMIEQCAFDNILSEHVYYYTLSSLSIYLERNGFEVVDCSLNDTNGGSFRAYIRKKIANKKTFSTQPYRDVCLYRVSSLLAYEKSLMLDGVDAWRKFYLNIEALKFQIVTFIQIQKSKGKTIWGYGASTKGNTLLQYFGLDNTLIDGIADRSPAKWGLRTVGTNIPIHSEEEMRIAKPDYLLILPWHFITEFLKRESELRKLGTKFIVPCPSFEVI